MTSIEEYVTKHGANKTKLTRALSASAKTKNNDRLKRRYVGVQNNNGRAGKIVMLKPVDNPDTMGLRFVEAKTGKPWYTWNGNAH